LTDRVLGFVIEQTGLRREKLNLGSRLSFDLEIEGVDAEEFFDQFRVEFSVDISDLERRWNAYFAPDGVSLAVAAIVFVPAIGLTILFCSVWPRGPVWICALMGFALSYAGLCSWVAKTLRPGLNEITIADLVKAAQTGRLQLNSIPEKSEREILTY